MLLKNLPPLQSHSTVQTLVLTILTIRFNLDEKEIEGERDNVTKIGFNIKFVIILIILSLIIAGDLILMLHQDQTIIQECIKDLFDNHNKHVSIWFQIFFY